MAIFDDIQRVDNVTGIAVAAIVIEDLQTINISTWSDTNRIPPS
jgi:hypothetical protein